MSGHYLITGGTGSFGRTMLKALLEQPDARITVLSRDEEKQFQLRTELGDPRVAFRIGDIRDYDSVLAATQGVDYVFHAAALKQVPSCEFFPDQAVMTNVIGSRNVIKASIRSGVKSVVSLSTDKAVFPVNAMGMTKALMEKQVQASARELGSEAGTVLSIVRYGNVMFSRGSVIPLFIRQIQAGLPITVTVPEMTRFLMPLADAVSLVQFAFEHAGQGDLFIRKAQSATLADLAQAVKELMGVPEHPVQVIGWRHGEKLSETLASAQELANAEDLGDYWRLRSDTRGLDYDKYFDEGSPDVEALHDLDSHTVPLMSVEQITQLLRQLPEIQAAGIGG